MQSIPFLLLKLENKWVLNNKGDDMIEEIYYTAAEYRNIKNDKGQKELGIGDFFHTGTLAEAKEYIKKKQRDTNQNLKLFKLVEIE